MTKTYVINIKIELDKEEATPENIKKCIASVYRELTSYKELPAQIVGSIDDVKRVASGCFEVVVK